MAEWSRTLHFVNLVYQTRGFGSPQTPYDGNCTKDAQGWPTQDFGVPLITQDSGPSPYGIAMNGTYLIRATGNATVELVLTSGSVVNQSYDASTNTLTAFAEIEPEGSGLFWLRFVNTRRSPSDPLGSGLTNLTVLQPGYGPERGGPFDFTDNLVGLVSRFDTLRFMDLAATNGNMVQNWTERTTVDDACWFCINNGIPWESMAALANQVQRDMWINVSCAVTDVICIITTNWKSTPVTMYSGLP
jgi:hypothetical protein